MRLNDLPDGELHEEEILLDGEMESVIIHRQGERVSAWLNICPHAGRRLDWAPGKFLRSKEGFLVCAAHGASFEIEHGECVAGACKGQFLPVVHVSVDNGEVTFTAHAANP